MQHQPQRKQLGFEAGDQDLQKVGQRLVTRRKEMGCIFAGVALAVPRVLMVFVFLFSDWFGRAFDTRFWPLLGFLFMPYTTIAYLAAMLYNSHALSGGWLAVFMVAIVVDAGHWGGGRLAYRRR